MVERTFRKASALPENQDPVKQFADASISASETDKKSEFIFGHSLFTYYPEREGFVVMKKDGRRVYLTITENSVLEVMARKAGRLAEFREFAHIWDGQSLHYVLKKNIQRLRHKLGDEKVGDKFSIIKSVHSVGYILSDPLDTQQENHFPSTEHGTRNIQPQVTIYEGKRQDIRLTGEPDKEFAYIHSSGPVYFPERSSMLTIDGEETFLNHRDKKLFEMLAENQGKVLSREQLDQAVRGDGEEILLTDVSLLRKDIGHLRRKIKDKKEDTGTVGRKNFTFIRTVHGKGYVLVTTFQ